MLPPATGLFPRLALEDHYLGDVKIYKGTSVNFRIDCLYVHPEVY